MSFIYSNPLHPPVEQYNQSSFTSLSTPSGAGHQQRQPAGFMSASRIRIPQTPYTSSSKWKASMSRSSNLCAPITFDVIGYYGQGVPMRELSSRSGNALSRIITGSDDDVGRAIASNGQRKIVFKINWPGYPHVDWTRTIELSVHGASLTRGQLGAIVSQNFSRFIEKEQYAGTRELQWRFGTGGILYDSLILVSLNNVCEDVWVADIAYDSR